MIDDNYYQPVLSANFHNELTISPGGLVSNPSLKMMTPDLGGQDVSRNQHHLLTEFSQNSFSNRKGMSVQPPPTNYTSR